jgi:predicted HTH transcriptional regulator
VIINSLYHGKKVTPELEEFLPGLPKTGTVIRKSDGYALRKDLAKMRSIDALSELLRQNDSINDNIDPANDPVNAIIEIIRQNKRATYEQIANALSVSRATIRRHIKALRDSGKLRRIGADKTGYWEVKDD